MKAQTILLKKPAKKPKIASVCDNGIEVRQNGSASHE
jgi:hypothetical protein